jgi:hypothetical protein
MASGRRMGECTTVVGRKDAIQQGHLCHHISPTHAETHSYESPIKRKRAQRDTLSKPASIPKLETSRIGRSARSQIRTGRSRRDRSPLQKYPQCPVIERMLAESWAEYRAVIHPNSKCLLTPCITKGSLINIVWFIYPIQSESNRNRVYYYIDCKISEIASN